MHEPVAVGQRVRLDRMGGNDPCPIAPGSEGTVRSCTLFARGQWIIGVDWDSGRSLNLCTPEDSFTVIEGAA